MIGKFAVGDIVRFRNTASDVCVPPDQIGETVTVDSFEVVSGGIIYKVKDANGNLWTVSEYHIQTV